MNQYEQDRIKVRKEMTEGYNFTAKQAEIVEEYAYQELHSFWSDYLNCWTDIADMVYQVLNEG